MMSTKNDIISELYLSKDFCSCIKKMQPEHLQDDLKAEVITVLCELNEEKIQRLHNDKSLGFYAVRIILNMVRNKEHPFQKKFRSVHIELTNQDVADDYNLEEAQIRQTLEDATLEAINGLYWYDAELVRLYMKHGNFRALQKDTGIPLASCYRTIKNAFNTLKKESVKSNKPLFSEEEIRSI